MEEFESIIEKHKGIVIKVAGSYAKDIEERKDLCQDIIIALWSSYGNYDDSKPFSTWAYRIALNIAISSFRKENTRQKHHTDYGQLVEMIEDDHDIENEKYELLQRFIVALDDLNRALILLYLEGKPYQEIADIMGISQTNVATKLSRIKMRFKEQNLTAKSI